MTSDAVVGIVRSMTCRHSPGDPACSSYVPLPATPDSEKYSIEDYVEVGKYMVLKVQYPNCAKCSYEGNKVMVFHKVAVKDMLKWRKLDPHFRDDGRSARLPHEAPSPVARFPASQIGWAHAIALAKMLTEHDGKRDAKVFTDLIDAEGNKTHRTREE